MLSAGSSVEENTHTLNTCRSQEDKLHWHSSNVLSKPSALTHKPDFWAPQAQLFCWGSRLSSHCPLVRLCFFHTALFCVGIWQLISSSSFPTSQEVFQIINTGESISREEIQIFVEDMWLCFLWRWSAVPGCCNDLHFVLFIEQDDCKSAYHFSLCLSETNPRVLRSSSWMFSRERTIPLTFLL